MLIKQVKKNKNLLNLILKKTYIDKFNIHEWNYYKIYDHRTNNACEYIEIDNLKKGNIIYKKKRGWRSFESISIPYYKVYDEEIKKINVK